MRKTIRDAIASVCVAAIVVPYVGYLIWDEMPFIQDPRGMSAVALILGLIAFLVAGLPATTTAVGKLEWTIVAATFALGVVALAVAETAAAELLPALFIGAIVAAWAVEALEHAGMIGRHTGGPVPH